jgi:small multidrug resistance pump
MVVRSKPARARHRRPAAKIASRRTASGNFRHRRLCLATPKIIYRLVGILKTAIDRSAGGRLESDTAPGFSDGLMRRRADKEHGDEPMKPYLFLCGAIVAEVVGTLALKYSDGMTRLVPSALVVVGYGFSFWLLALSLRDLPVGIVYATFAGATVAVTATVGVVLLREPAGLTSILGITFIVVGVMLLAANMNKY